jgi:hypothetical protein
VNSVTTFLKDFWHQMMSVLGDVADFMIEVFDKNSGPWPKITVGGIFLLVVLIVVSKSSKPR